MLFFVQQNRRASPFLLPPIKTKQLYFLLALLKQGPFFKGKC